MASPSPTPRTRKGPHAPLAMRRSISESGLESPSPSSSLNYNKPLPTPPTSASSFSSERSTLSPASSNSSLSLSWTPTSPPRSRTNTSSSTASGRLSPLLRGLGISTSPGSSSSSPSPRSHFNESTTYPRTEHLTPPRRPVLSRHQRSKSSNILPAPQPPALTRSSSLPNARLAIMPEITQTPPTPVDRLTSHPSPFFSTPPRRPSSPSYGYNRTHTPSPPPSLISEHYPTSLPTLSRSPSMSSLETIEDTPEEEEIAEAEPIPPPMPAAMIRSLTGEGPRRTGLERKRWSVCGAEKRADLELETIWEERGRGEEVFLRGEEED